MQSVGPSVTCVLNANADEATTSTSKLSMRVFSLHCFHVCCLRVLVFVIWRRAALQLPYTTSKILTKVSQTTLTGVDTQSWLSSPEAVEMTKRLMLEVISVGQRCGVPLKDELVSVLLERIMVLPGIYSSMYVDAKEGRHIEIDVILGYPMRRAKEFGMDVPTLATLYALLKAVDGRLGK